MVCLLFLLKVVVFDFMVSLATKIEKTPSHHDQNGDALLACM
jgi:hypothetical protein